MIFAWWKARREARESKAESELRERALMLALQAGATGVGVADLAARYVTYIKCGLWR